MARKERGKDPVGHHKERIDGYGLNGCNGYDDDYGWVVKIYAGVLFSRPYNR